VFVTGYTLTVVPLGSAPAGTVTVSTRPPEVSKTVDEVVPDTVPDVGVPNVDAGTVALVGAGALVGPVEEFDDPPDAAGSVWYAPLSHDELRRWPTDPLRGRRAVKSPITDRRTLRN